MTYIEKRLDSLYEIDCQVVSLLDNVSSLFETYSSNENSDKTKEQFEKQTKNIYGLISDIAIGLRKEVKLMDDNIGVYDKNEDNVMILPLSVDQKNTQLGEKRLKDELKELNKLTN